MSDINRMEEALNLANQLAEAHQERRITTEEYLGQIKNTLTNYSDVDATVFYEDTRDNSRLLDTVERFEELRRVI